MSHTTFLIIDRCRWNSCCDFSLRRISSCTLGELSGSICAESIARLKIVLSRDYSGWEDLSENLERIHRVITQDRFSSLGLSSGLEIRAHRYCIEPDRFLMFQVILVIHIEVVHLEYFLLPLHHHTDEEIAFAMHKLVHLHRQQRDSSVWNCQVLTIRLKCL